MCDTDEVDAAIESVYDMIEEIIQDGDVPYMLLVPERLHAYLVEEFNDMKVYPVRDVYLSCISAPTSAFFKGCLRVH